MHIGIIKEEIYHSADKWISDFRFQRGPFYPLPFKFVSVRLLSLKPQSWAAPDKVVNLLKVIFGTSIFQFNCLLSSVVTSFYKVQQLNHLWQRASICLYSRTLNQQTIFLNISNFSQRGHFDWLDITYCRLCLSQRPLTSGPLRSTSQFSGQCDGCPPWVMCSLT